MGQMRNCPKCGSSDVQQMAAMFSHKSAPKQFEMKRGPGHNPYANLTLHHIRDEKGRPIKVNSERELHAAEKRYGFIHAASAGLHNTPPVHDPGSGDITKGYKWKWQRDPKKQKDAKGVEAGIAPTDKHTLAYHPTSTKEVGT